MDVKWLDDFLAVVECRSFTRAARQRNTSQSGLSRRIQSLEHWVGGSLVDRDAHPFRLTEMGNRFLPLATNLRSALMAVRQLCAADVSERDAPVTLAVAEGLESGMLPVLLSRLKEQGITTPVRVVIKNLAAATAALLEGEADFWLTLQHPQLPLVMDEEAFEAITVAHDRLSLMVGTAPTGRPLHMLPGTREKPAPVIEYGTDDYFSQVVGMQLAAAPTRLHMQATCAADSLHSLRALVRQGLGLTFLPESMVRDELQRGELSIADLRWSTRLDIRLVRPRPAASGDSTTDVTDLLWDRLQLREKGPSSTSAAMGTLARQSVRLGANV